MALAKIDIEDNIDHYRQVLANDLLAFTAFLFSILHPQKNFHQNWHHEVLAAWLEYCAKGGTKRLIINQPPRSAKSTFTSIAYPLWLLLRNPELEILCTSYGEELCRQFAQGSRQFVESPRVQALFPGVWRVGRRHDEIITRQGGRRYMVPAGGAITGQGADVIIIDDPLKASDANTKVRENINDWFDANILQRLNNKNTGCIIVNQQRLHTDDLSGHLLKTSDEWHHLSIQAIAQQNEYYRFQTGRVIGRDKGDALQPHSENLDQLQEIKNQIGSFLFQAQYQQIPSAAESGIIKGEWFKEFNPDYPPYINRYGLDRSSLCIQAWDVASTIHARSDYSVCVTLVEYDDRYYVLDVFRDKLEFPDLLRKMKEHYEKYPVTNLLIEDIGPGKAALQALQDDVFDAQSVLPKGDKLTRLLSVSGIVESGRVHLPFRADWRDDFTLELTAFPGAPHDDQVDAFAYALDFTRIKEGQFMYA